MTIKMKASYKNLESEVIVRLDMKDQQAHICVCQWPAMARKMEKRYGVPIEVGTSARPQDRGKALTARWVVPLKAITFRSIESLTAKRQAAKGSVDALRKARLARKAAA